MPDELDAVAARLRATDGDNQRPLRLTYAGRWLWYDDGDGVGEIRGNLGAGHDAYAVGVLLAHAPADLRTLLAEVERLRADGDEMQRAAERDDANVLADRLLDESLAVCRALGIDTSKDYDLLAEATRVRAERDALRADVARLQVSLAATDEGLRAELDRMHAALAAAHREIAEDDEGYAGVDE